MKISMKNYFIKYVAVAACMLGLIKLHAQKDTSFVATGNPIIKHKFTADPAALVYKDKVYIYTGHDVAPEKRNGYEMHEWLLFSTSDMKTFTEHPSPLIDRRPCGLNLG